MYLVPKFCMLKNVFVMASMSPKHLQIHIELLQLLIGNRQLQHMNKKGLTPVLVASQIFV